MKTRPSSFVLCAVVSSMAALFLSRPVLGQSAEVAAGTFTSQSLGGGEWQYNITLANKSPVNNADTTIGTFWFSWAPGQDYMQAVPTNIQAPTGWADKITGLGNSTDGSAIQYVAMSGDLLMAGKSLSGFIFDSTETPTQLFGPSPLFQNQTETTSAAYTQGPFSDSTTVGDVFIVTPASVMNGGGGSGNTGGSGGSTGGGGGGVSGVPLPAASWQVIAAFIGFGLVVGGKKVKKYMMA